MTEQRRAKTLIQLWFSPSTPVQSFGQSYTYFVRLVYQWFFAALGKLWLLLVNGWLHLFPVNYKHLG